MFNPNKEETDENGQPMGHIVDMVLNMCLDICRKKYGPGLDKAFPFAMALQYLQNPVCNHYPKLFLIFHMVVHETEVADFFRETFHLDSMGNVWGDTCVEHFNKFCNKLERLITDTRHKPFSEFNIINIVEETVRIAKRLYMTE